MKHHIRITKSQDDHGERMVPIRRGATVLAAIFWTALILSGGVYVTWYLKNSKQDGSADVAIKSRPLTAEDYIAAIARKMLLPADSSYPRIEVISDPQLLTDEQDFFRGSEAGDVLVIFEESKRAILYSPRRDIIVNVGPIVPKKVIQENRDTVSLDNNLSN